MNLTTLKQKWQSSAIYQKRDHKYIEKARNALCNDNFSILCSNCIGGIIYHRLGKQFLSPTINMHMSNPDFVSFCLHLDTYLGQNLTFIQADENHPVALLSAAGLKTIKLYFNHANSEAEAQEDWDRRKTRIQKDNLFLILYNLDGITLQELRQLETVPCRNKVIFTATPIPEIPWSCCIKPTPHRQNAACYIDRDIWGVRTFEKHFDYVAWLNTEQPA